MILKWSLDTQNGATPVIKRGNSARKEGIWRLSGEMMRAVEPKSSYEYPGILEVDVIKHNIKEKNKEGIPATSDKNAEY